MATYTNTNDLYNYDGSVLAPSGTSFTVERCYTSCGYRWVDMVDTNGHRFNVREDALASFFANQSRKALFFKV